MTSATEVVRRLLDERGVEYRTHGTTDRTWFEVGNISWFIIEREKGSLTVDAVSLTPEQAIAVTLGSCNCSDNCANSERTGTCHIEPWKMERDTGFYDCMECECGYVSDVSDWAKWHFCPNCGRRIVEPTTNDVGAEVDA